MVEPDRHLAAAGRPLTSAELAAAAGCAERYVREWLNGQAASGYVTYVGDGRYTLDEEQAVAFTDENSPACVIGGFQSMLAATRAVDRLTVNFRTGEGWLFYSVSTLVCTPASLSQEVGTALGGQAGETRLRDVVTGAGITRFRRAAQTPFNLVLEARP